jgi:hypothetical protein
LEWIIELLIRFGSGDRLWGSIPSAAAPGSSVPASHKSAVSGLVGWLADHLTAGREEAPACNVPVLVDPVGELPVGITVVSVLGTTVVALK